MHLIDMNKKTILLFLVTALSFTYTFSQKVFPIKNLYTYKQASIPGIQPNTSEGREIKEKQTTYNYWFYLAVNKNEKIIVSDLWISGKIFNAKSEKIEKLPVYKINYSGASGNDSLTLVPLTKNNVFLVFPVGETKDSGSISNYLKDLVSKYELVIVYYWRGKKFYKLFRKITELEPEARM